MKEDGPSWLDQRQAAARVEERSKKRIKDPTTPAFERGRAFQQGADAGRMKDVLDGKSDRKPRQAGE